MGHRAVSFPERSPLLSENLTLPAVPSTYCQLA